MYTLSCLMWYVESTFPNKAPEDVKSSNELTDSKLGVCMQAVAPTKFPPEQANGTENESGNVQNQH